VPLIVRQKQAKSLEATGAYENRPPYRLFEANPRVDENALQPMLRGRKPWVPMRLSGARKRTRSENIHLDRRGQTNAPHGVTHTR
jgi:hypothetical protein